MLDERELKNEIGRLECTESSWDNYKKLATLYIIRREQEEQSGNDRMSGDYGYSAAAAPVPAMPEPTSEFLKLVTEVDPVGAWAIMDDLMSSLQVVNPRVYDSVMRKLDRL